MKKVLLCWGLAALFLSSCSLLQRSTNELEADSHQPPFDPAESRETLDALTTAPANLEAEVSRLNTKVSALETKIDVLSASLERTQMQRSQPVIEAESTAQTQPQVNMAAPVEEEPLEEASSVPAQISAAPVRPMSLPPVAKAPAISSSASEREFRSAMELFQGGKNLEAASRFALFAKKYPQHLLASHALYWAGEASARGQQWSLAMENWEDLEKRYPRSTYLPEALAGLAKAYESQGNPSKARSYRDALLKSFPKSPVALTMQAGSSQPLTPSLGVGAGRRTVAPRDTEENIPSYDEEGSEEEAVTE